MESTTPEGSRPVSRRAPRLADVPDLFLRPSTFFAAVSLDHRWWYGSILCLWGISQSSARIDQSLMRAELGQPRPGWEELGPWVTGSWASFWTVLLVAGLVGALFYWYVGGWWYRLRLRFSGAVAPDARTARLVMTSAAAVVALPTVLFLIGYTLAFPDYLAAWNSDEAFSTVLLAFPFWGAYVSYRGVRTRFDVGRWRSRIWFLILPCLTFVMALGLIAVLYAILFEPLVQDGGGTLAGLSGPR